MLLISAAALIAVTGAVRAQTKRFDGVTLRVNGFGGEYDKVLVKHVARPLREKYGLNVVYTPGSTSSDLVKLIVSKDNPPYDLFMADSPLMPSMIEAGVILPIDPKAVPELERVRPQFKEFGQYGVPFAVASVLPLYNAKRTKPITSYSDLTRPDLKGRVAFQNPSSTAGSLTLLALAEENGGSIDNMEPGFSKLREMKSNMIGAPTATVNLIQYFQSEEAWAGAFWDGRIASMRREGVAVEAVVPKIGIYSVVTSVNPVVNSKHPEAVQAYLRQALSDEATVGLAAALAYAPTTDVKVPEDIAKTLLTYGDSLKLLHPVDWAKFAKVRGGWLERFNKEMR
ncbi:extracellular solute-binding protein [Bradyrhizobium sp. CCBAU 53380]|uniref:extracellular solute-binding protein n=1 Tax=Bradyrhizobium sp. CCBAU 53380 TaxID=1325117 RepID=UPI0023031316|nr:extracellular solute-binding protein [Bradyrhizobium sp. CCBAU 53380]MDA9421020.1 hypothetical protein [Bradyrhizobium sp. CCBAU 53380]